MGHNVGNLTVLHGIVQEILQQYSAVGFYLFSEMQYQESIFLILCSPV